MCAPAAAGAAGDLGKSVLQLQVTACPVRKRHMPGCRRTGMRRLLSLVHTSDGRGVKR